MRTLRSVCCEVRRSGVDTVDVAVPDASPREARLELQFFLRIWAHERSAAAPCIVEGLS